MGINDFNPDGDAVTTWSLAACVRKKQPWGEGTYPSFESLGETITCSEKDLPEPPSGCVWFPEIIAG